MSLTYFQIEQLFEEQRHILARHLMRLVRSREIAADLVQETFVRLTGLVGGERVQYPRAFLFRTATNLAIDYLRRKKVDSHLTDPSPLEDGFEVPSLTATPERELSGKQQLRLVQQAIDGLPPRTREAFLLHRAHDCSYQEIASRLGISESAVDKLMTRALKHCWAALEHHEDT